MDGGVRVYFSSFMNQRKGGRGERNSQFGKAFPENSPIIARILDSTYIHTHTYAHFPHPFTHRPSFHLFHPPAAKSAEKQRAGRTREGEKKGDTGKKSKGWDWWKTERRKIRGHGFSTFLWPGERNVWRGTFSLQEYICICIYPKNAHIQKSKSADFYV